MSTFEPACLHRNCPGDVSGPGHSSFLQFDSAQVPMCWSHIIPLEGLFGPPGRAEPFLLWTARIPSQKDSKLACHGRDVSLLYLAISSDVWQLLAY